MQTLIKRSHKSRSSRLLPPQLVRVLLPLPRVRILKRWWHSRLSLWHSRLSFARKLPPWRFARRRRSKGARHSVTSWTMHVKERWCLRRHFQRCRLALRPLRKPKNRLKGGAQKPQS